MNKAIDKQTTDSISDNIEIILFKTEISNKSFLINEQIKTEQE